jgi:uncharacterized protein (DUF58 family)
MLLSFVLLGFAVGRFISSRAMLLLVYGAVVVLVAAYLMGRRRLSVEARRSDLPTRVREGQAVNVELGLTAKRRISTIILEEELPEPLGTSVRIPVPVLPSGDEVHHHYTFSPTRRGIYEVGPLVAVWSDPFGLTKHRMTVCPPTPVIVHPRVEPVLDRIISREWEDPPIRPPVSKPWPTGFEFYGMRDYVAGDDPRRIVWRALAQHGKYLVRESEQGITDRVTVALDTDADSHSPGEASETFELAVRVAASLGSKHLKDGFSVNLEGNSGPLARSLRGQNNQIPLLDRLAGVTREKVKLADEIDRLLTTAQRNAHHVVITPHLSPQVATRLRLLLERGISLVLVVVLWDGSDPLSLHRAGSLGCAVVELNAGTALDLAFRHVLGQARR